MIWILVDLTKPTSKHCPPLLFKFQMQWPFFLFFEHVEFIPTLISQHHLFLIWKSHLYDHGMIDSSFSPWLNVSFIVRSFSDLAIHTVTFYHIINYTSLHRICFQVLLVHYQSLPNKCKLQGVQRFCLFCSSLQPYAQNIAHTDKQLE